MKHILLATTALVTALAAVPAMAQQQTPSTTQGQTQMQQAAPSGGSMTFAVKQGANDWLASDLIGRSVVNRNNETLGRINDVILDENGQVAAVLIGVGGFLGIGEKEVGVPFEALEFKMAREVPQAPGQPTEGQPAPQPAQRSGQAPSAGADKSHSDMQIVLATTKEVLDSAPSYTKLGEKPDTSSQGSSTNK